MVDQSAVLARVIHIDMIMEYTVRRGVCASLIFDWRSRMFRMSLKCKDWAVRSWCRNQGSETSPGRAQKSGK